MWPTKARAWVKAARPRLQAEPSPLDASSSVLLVVLLPDCHPLLAPLQRSAECADLIVWYTDFDYKTTGVLIGEGILEAGGRVDQKEWDINQPGLQVSDTILGHGTYKSTCRVGDRNVHGHLGTMNSYFPETRKSTRPMDQCLAMGVLSFQDGLGGPSWTWAAKDWVGQMLLSHCVPA